MPHGLDEHKRAVEHQRHNRRENKLRWTEVRTGHGGRNVWQHQREDRERRQDRQRRACALDLKPLLVMARAARQQAHTDDSIAHDHDGRKHRVTRQFCLSARRREHDRDNQRDLDHRHRDGEHQRAKGFAGAVRNHFGVVDGGEHRRPSVRPPQPRPSECRHRTTAPSRERPRPPAGMPTSTAASRLFLPLRWSGGAGSLSFPPRGLDLAAAPRRRLCSLRRFCRQDRNRLDFEQCARPRQL